MVQVEGDQVAAAARFHRARAVHKRIYRATAEQRVEGFAKAPVAGLVYADQTDIVFAPVEAVED